MNTYLKISIVDICIFSQIILYHIISEDSELLYFKGYMSVIYIYFDEYDNVFIITLFNFLKKAIII